MKKIIFVAILSLEFLCIAIADDLADILQDLAVQTACLGMYSTAQTGVAVSSRYDDPHDWYTPSMLANRFAAMSGNMTRTITFYGVCFDYAQFAWDHIKKYQGLYNRAGMKGQQWYIVSTGNDPNTIILYDPVSRNNATVIQNGVYLREHSRYNIYAHDGARNHSWIWVQHNNGTWYWIDPTWTDNTGYVWWGKVENGREVQYYPDSVYCVASDYPKPRSVADNSRPQSSSQPQTSSSYSPANSSYIAVGYNYTHGLPMGITIADSMFFGGSLIYISANTNILNSDSSNLLEFEWIYGIALYINNFLRIPIGIGVNHLEREVQVSSGRTNGAVTSYSDSSDDWDHKFVLEIGLQPVIFKHFYISVTYRLKGFSTSGFSIGSGIIF